MISERAASHGKLYDKRPEKGSGHGATQGGTLDERPFTSTPENETPSEPSPEGVSQRCVRYFDAVPPGVSFGGMPMTFTPDPRATSIASMMSEYFARGEPFTKITFSGRGS